MTKVFELVEAIVRDDGQIAWVRKALIPEYQDDQVTYSLPCAERMLKSWRDHPDVFGISSDKLNMFEAAINKRKEQIK